MVVYDLLNPTKGIFDIDEVVCRSRMIAYDGKDGRIVFDTNKNNRKFYEKYYKCEITSIWADVKEIKGVAFGNYFTPVLCVYLLHDEVEQCRKEQP